jgi:hypothetical protein
MIQTILETNFIEAKTVEEANQIDLAVYTFVTFSDSRGCYIFKRRARV